MKSVAFFTNKGGVGKTTLVCNLAAAMAESQNKKMLLVDADPQANATQYMFDDKLIDKIYDEKSVYTIYSMARPLSQGKGFSEEKLFRESKNFGVDVLLGDPRLALIEDTLAGDWVTSGVRGLRTTFLFRELLQHCNDYDFVFFDMGPSLGSINRSVLIGCDYFILPLSNDIFSVRATENISTWIREWKKRLDLQLSSIDDLSEIEVKDLEFRLKLIGYVNQQYQAKRNSLTGERRAVRAYEKIMKTIPEAISKSISNTLELGDPEFDYSIGSIPNLHSLIPMSQVSRKPIFSLKSSDGVVGAHFLKVAETKELYFEICERFLDLLGIIDD
ncbi:ParA family protein [Martelella sp. FOR1707]